MNIRLRNSCRYIIHNALKRLTKWLSLACLLSTTKAQFCIPGSQDSSFHLCDIKNRLKVGVLKSANPFYFTVNISTDCLHSRSIIEQPS